MENKSVNSQNIVERLRGLDDTKQSKHVKQILTTLYLIDIDQSHQRLAGILSILTWHYEQSSIT